MFWRGTGSAHFTRVRREGKVALAIRTVVVTTASAVQTHREAGNELLARTAVARGMELLEDVKRDLGSEAEDEVGRLYVDARRELRAMTEGVRRAPAASAT